MKNKICGKKINETVEKNMENRTNQNDGNSNTACTGL